VRFNCYPGVYRELYNLDDSAVEVEIDPIFADWPNPVAWPGKRERSLFILSFVNYEVGPANFGIFWRRSANVFCDPNGANRIANSQAFAFPKHINHGRVGRKRGGLFAPLFCGEKSMN